MYKCCARPVREGRATLEEGARNAKPRAGRASAELTSVLDWALGWRLFRSQRGPDLSVPRQMFFASVSPLAESQAPKDWRPECFGLEVVIQQYQAFAHERQNAQREDVSRHKKHDVRHINPPIDVALIGEAMSRSKRRLATMTASATGSPILVPFEVLFVRRIKAR
jgi:hypothetical protein